MAGNQTQFTRTHVNLQTAGDWLAPAIALVAVAAMLLALISALFESVQ